MNIMAADDLVIAGARWSIVIILPQIIWIIPVMNGMDEHDILVYMYMTYQSSLCQHWIYHEYF